MTEDAIPKKREAVLAQYRPIRASVQAALDRALHHCRKPDFDRAAKHLDLVDEAQLDQEQTSMMLADIALFEPNQRGRRVIDTFIGKGLDELDPKDRETASRLGSAFFSIFRVEGWHEAGGVWLRDLLAPERRVRVMDESMEANAPEGMVLALRVFDAGPFHAGFGIVTQPDEEAVAFCTGAAASGGSPPDRHSLAATLYGDAIARASVPVALDEMVNAVETKEDAAVVIGGLLELLGTMEAGTASPPRKAGRGRSARKGR